MLMAPTLILCCTCSEQAIAIIGLLHYILRLNKVYKM